MWAIPVITTITDGTIIINITVTITVTTTGITTGITGSSFTHTCPITRL